MSKQDKNNNSNVRILALDIETQYTTAGVWSLWNQNVGINQILEPGKVICYAVKWLGSKEIKFKRFDEPDFLEAIHALLSEADAVLTFNGKSFDIPHLNREFVKADMAPPSPFKHVDLFLTAKRQFNFPSNKMQFICQELGLGSKVDHEGFPLWIKCANNDPAAWKKMEKYNKQDVKLLEKLYKKFRSWTVGHPNANLYRTDGISVCPTCGSDHLHSRGHYRTQTAIYNRKQCQVCGSWSRTRYTEVDAEHRKSVLVSAAL